MEAGPKYSYLEGFIALLSLRISQATYNILLQYNSYNTRELKAMPILSPCVSSSFDFILICHASHPLCLCILPGILFQFTNVSLQPVSLYHSLDGFDRVGSFFFPTP